MTEGEWSRVGEIPEELHDYELEDGTAHNNNHKHVVLHDTFEHVYFLHLSRVDLIKQLHKKIQNITMSPFPHYKHMNKCNFAKNIKKGFVA